MDGDPVDRVLRQAHERFADFSMKRSMLEPRLLRDATARHRGLARSLAPLALLPLGHAGKGGSRLIFLSSRFRWLLEAVREDQPIVVGNLRDLRAARELAVSFSFSGDLMATCYPIIDGRAGFASRLVVKRWLKFFRRQSERCVLIVPHDTLPISTLLVSIANECRNVVTVCIQHGLFDSSFQLDDIDGRNCRINLVYDRAQRAEIERRLPDVIAEEMGLPTDFRAKVRRTAPLVVLVGTGVPECLVRYERALSVFAEGAAVLRSAGLAVEYRPHPSESPNHLQKFGIPLNTMEKSALLASERRIFVGFSSTLLYEAGSAGHGVILLEDPAIPGSILVPGSISLPTSGLDELGRLAGAVMYTSDACTDAPLPLRDRFYSALDRALARLDRNLR
jgi:hypothetical protein